MLEERRLKEEKERKDTEKTEELKMQLRILEEQAEKMKQAVAKTYNQNGERLLSYEDGFGWCSECKHVSYIPKTSDNKGLGLRGCQGRGCPNHTPGKNGWSPYQPEDFVYEGRKVLEECIWYTSRRK